MNCLKCHKKLIKPDQKKFCSYSCASSYNRKGKKHSPESIALISKNRKGKGTRERQPRWKGGVVIRDGYKYILMPNHPNTTKSGYILEHRVVMEKYIGRYLNMDEIIHHINKNRLDNRIENLQLLTHGEHSTLHHKGISNPKKAIFGNTYRQGKKMSPEARLKISMAVKKRWEDGKYDKTNFHP